MLPADCCDGTDELSGCKNTCIEKNSAKREAIKKQIDDYQAALDRKAQYAAGAAGVRDNIKQRHANVDSDIEKAEKELERLTGEHPPGSRQHYRNLHLVTIPMLCSTFPVHTSGLQQLQR